MGLKTAEMAPAGLKSAKIRSGIYTAWTVFVPIGHQNAFQMYLYIPWSVVGHILIVVSSLLKPNDFQNFGKFWKMRRFSPGARLLALEEPFSAPEIFMQSGNRYTVKRGPKDCVYCKLGEKIKVRSRAHFWLPGLKKFWGLSELCVGVSKRAILAGFWVRFVVEVVRAGEAMEARW